MTIPEYLRSSRDELETECRRRARAAYIGGDTVIARCLGQFQMFLDTREDAITPWLILDGFWEAWITLAVARHVQPASYCLDIGANHGYYTVLLAALAGPKGRVVAIEPIPRLVGLLARTSVSNAFSEYVSLLAGLAWSQRGQEMEVCVPHNSLNASVIGTDGARLRTTTVCVDDLTADWPRADFAKVDVEGAEIEVWEGMQRTLARFPQMTVLIEIDITRYPDRARDFLQSIVRVFPQLRYVDFAGQLQPVAMEQVLAEPEHGMWMLWLAR